MIKQTLTIFLILLSIVCFSQNVGISAIGVPPDASAGLDVYFTDKGVLIPRVALVQTDSNAPIGAAIVESLLVYNTDYVNDVTPGYYYWYGSMWLRLLTSGHFQSQQINTPTIAANPYIVYSLNNATDVAGVVNVFTWNAIGTVTVTFSNPYNIAPIVLITAASSGTAQTLVSGRVYVTSTVNDFTINFGANPGIGMKIYNYFVIETQ